MKKHKTITKEGEKKIVLHPYILTDNSNPQPGDWNSFFSSLDQKKIEMYSLFCEMLVQKIYNEDNLGSQNVSFILERFEIITTDFSKILSQEESFESLNPIIINLPDLLQNKEARKNVIANLTEIRKYLPGIDEQVIYQYEHFV